MSRKLGVPGQEELAFGAVASGEIAFSIGKSRKGGNLRRRVNDHGEC